MYQPTLGRFMSRDPLPEDGVTVLSPVPDMRSYGQLAQEHWYVYVENNPANLSDPTGLFSMSTKGELTGSEGEVDPECDCDEKLVATAAVNLFEKILDVELPENIDPSVNPVEEKRFKRKRPLVITGARSVTALLAGKEYKVFCCKKDSTLRLIGRKLLKDDKVRRTDRNVPTPPGPPTRSNMMKVANCGYPVPFLWHSEGKDDITRCLKLSFPKAEFGPKDIVRQTDLNKCGRGATRDGDSTE